MSYLAAAAGVSSLNLMLARVTDIQSQLSELVYFQPVHIAVPVNSRLRMLQERAGKPPLG